MPSASPCCLAINGGSSSIRFAVYAGGKKPQLLLAGKIDRIGASGTRLAVTFPVAKSAQEFPLVAADYRTAAEFLLDWLEARPVFASIKAVGHRIVHGMHHADPERITAKLLIARSVGRVLGVAAVP